MPPAPNQSPIHVRSWFLGSDEERQEELIGSSSSHPKKLPMATTSTSSLAGKTQPTRVSPIPNTILDRKALLKALDDAGLVVKSKYIEYLYEHLHRQNYPPLKDFVQHYKNTLAENPAELSISSEDSTSIGSPGGSTKDKHHHSLYHHYSRHRLPSKLLNFLENPNNGFVTTTSKVVGKEASVSGNSIKLVIALHDGLLIETHSMRYHEENGDHASVSVSSQVGCDVGCSAFCPVASMGFRGNLTSGEILEQVVHAQQVFREDNQVSNGHVVQKVTFMGSGEPLHNYEHVVDACHELSNKKLWNLCRGRITISTVGITPRIYDLTRDLPDVILALGLHAPNQDLRRAIVPVAQQYPLDGLLQALDNHMNDPQDRVQGSLLSPSGRKRRMAMVEYIMMEGKTSSLECAHELGRLCENRHLVVNLIPYIIHNDADDKRGCPTPAHIKEFQSIVASYGAICNVRLNMSVQMSKMVARQMGTERQKSFRDVPEDIEDLGFWQKLSFVRFRGWNKEALKDRQEKRRSSVGVPREIIAQKTDNSIVSKTTVVSGIVAGIAGGAAWGVAELVSSSTPTDEMQKELSFEDKEAGSPEASRYYSARRWVLPVAISAVIFCRIMLAERRR